MCAWLLEVAQVWSPPELEIGKEGLACKKVEWGARIGSPE